MKNHSVLIGMENFNHKFDKKSQILYKYYTGEISIKDITDSWRSMIENDLIPKDTKGFILDYRDARFSIHVKNSEHKEIPNFYQQNLNIFQGTKIAIVTENPKDITIPVLVKEMDDGYMSQPFTTIEAAINWILNT